MKPWLIVAASTGLILLIALTVMYGESPKKVEKNAVPKDLPKPVVGGLETEVPLATSTAPKFLPAELSGRLAPEALEIELTGNRIQTSPIENPVNSKIDGATRWADDELVLGVTVNQSARAYSLKQLAAATQSVVNDVVGGEPLVITWSSENRNAVVFHNPAGELPLVFRPVGQTWKTDLVFLDQSTESLWSQSLGQAIDGQLRGSSLKAIPSVVCTWRAWKKAFPETTLANLPESGPDSAITTMAQARSSLRNSGSLLIVSPKGEIEIPRTQLLESRVLNKELGGDKIAIFYDEDSDAVQAFNSLLVVAPALEFELRGLQFAPLRQNIGWNIHNGGADGENDPARRLQPLLVLQLPEPLKAIRKPVAGGTNQ
ncbi:MAG: DUF3179 domain-containing (seleno)protein [Planctomycetota bacterium]|jgi:hypothetical protein